MDFNTYKQQLVDYLERQRDFEQAEILEHESLGDQEKVEQGFLIQNAKITGIDKVSETLSLSVSENNTKWRTGDKIRYQSTKDPAICGSCVILDNFADEIILAAKSASFHKGTTLDLYLVEASMTSMICSAVSNINQGHPGSYFLEILGKLDEAEEEYGTPVPSGDLTSFNDEQANAIRATLKRPSVYALQGPPGTGKTAVLAAIAEAYGKYGKDVLILSYSHQAVNNALNSVCDKSKLPTFKIGSLYKTQGLSEDVEMIPDMRTFLSNRKAASKSYRHSPKTTGDVVGMTLHGAILNLVLRKKAFTPSIVLVDEASQIPLPIAAAIGAMGASTYVFIGDDRQMPPIFNQNMATDAMSISIFEHLHAVLPPSLQSVLTTTYRMNKVICSSLSKAFYEPYGIQLRSFSGIAERTVPDENLDQSLEIINVDSDKCQDENLQEALKAVEKAAWYSGKGMEVAVITPFRKQVNLIREEWQKAGHTTEILIDTVERLQGQDVDAIIISMAVNDVDYLNSVEAFLYMPNRLNVMISRAKRKVVVAKSPIVKFLSSHITSNM